MRFEWDPEKEATNRLKHGLTFQDAAELLGGGDDYLEIYDEHNSAAEDRFVAIGRIQRGAIVVVFTEPDDDVIRIVSARMATKREAASLWQYWRGKHE